MLRECFGKEQNKRINIITLPDWSMESDIEASEIWGRYFYYNVVSRINQKKFNLYYSDNPTILDRWFKNTEIFSYITYRNFERSDIFDGLSATNIRQAFIDNNKEYVKKFCPKSVVNRFDYLASYYKNVTNNPKEDFSMK